MTGLDPYFLGISDQAAQGQLAFYVGDPIRNVPLALVNLAGFTAVVYQAWDGDPVPGRYTLAAFRPVWRQDLLGGRYVGRTESWRSAMAWVFQMSIEQGQLLGLD